MFQWLRHHAPNAGGLGSIPGQGTRSHMPQLRAVQTSKFFVFFFLKDYIEVGKHVRRAGGNVKWYKHFGKQFGSS